MNRDLLVRLLGWRALFLHGDPCVWDRWRWARRWLLPGGLRTFDAGSGNGGFAVYASTLGNEVEAFSFSEREQTDARRRAALMGRGGVAFRLGDLRDLDRRSSELGHFDQIVCLETIEHLADDAKLVRDLSEMLNAGGRLLLTTPSEGHRPLYSERLSATEDGGHVRWGYTHDRLAELFNAAGLEVVHQGFVSGLVSQQLTNLMRVLGRPRQSLGWVLTLPLRPLQVVDRFVTELVGYPYLCVTSVGVRRS